MAKLAASEQVAAARSVKEPGDENPLSRYLASGSKTPLAFLNVIRPLLANGVRRLRTALGNLSQNYPEVPFEQETIIACLFAGLAQQLTAQIIRTCVLEMHVARTLGSLRGSTPEERFESFIQQLSMPEKAQPLLEEYAVLTRQCMLTIEQWITFSLELLSHLCADWQQICATFASETAPDLLVEAHIGAGDTHRGGKSVAILTFQSGFRLVYKPRSLALDLHFQELLLWLNARGSHPPFQTFSMLERGSYGWSAFIQARECPSEAEVRRFYQRQGAYLALLYVLDASDLHAENIIAQGEHPMLIDLEALFHPRVELNRPHATSDPALIVLQQSVVRVGMLPQRIWGNEEAKGVNISGLGGEEGQLSPREVPQWENVGTDLMRQVRTRVQMPVNKNRPMLNGKSVDALDYQACILAGFNEMYRTLLDHRAALLAEMLPRFARDEIRFIARPTDIYARFLYDSFRPELLRDASKRERHFERLRIGLEWQPYMEQIIPAECADFLQGDIPLFTAHPDSLDLFTSRGEVIPAFFQQTSLDMVRNRVAQLSEQDHTRQVWLINATFTCNALDTRRADAQPAPTKLQQTRLTRSRLLAAAREIGDELCQRAIESAGSAGWLGIRQAREQEWEVRAAGPDLYNGLPGIALFLAYLAELTGETRYLEYARAALRTIRQLLLDTPQKQQIVKCVGAFDGCGGLIYLFTHLGTLWNEPALLQEAEDLARLLLEVIEHDEAFDIMDGSAGCIVALLGLHAVAPAARILETAIRAGDHLLTHASSMSSGIGWKSSQQSTPLTGMAHGNAGIAFSLLKLAQRSGEERFRQAARAALAYERSLFSSEHQNWPDLRENRLKQPGAQDGQSFMAAWCHGAPGIALARMASLDILSESTLREEIEHALATTISASEKDNGDPTLCHGVAGLLETLLSARQTLARDAYTSQIEQLARRLLACWQRRASLEKSQLPAKWMESPGFMLGIAGIGYTFLRLADPLRVPSVLTLAEPSFQQVNASRYTSGE